MTGQKNRTIKLAGAVLAFVALGCSSADDAKKEDISASAYQLSGTYRAASAGPTTRFSEISFTHDGLLFSAVKANCAANCKVQGSYAMNAEGTTLRLSHDGIVESLAFAADPASTRTIRAATSSSGVKQSSLRPAGITVDLSIRPLCGAVLGAPASAPPGSPTSAIDCNSASTTANSQTDATELVNGGTGGELVNRGAGGEALVTGSEKLICAVVALLVEAFSVEDGDTDGTTTATLRPRADGRGKTSTTMTQKEAPAPVCTALAGTSPPIYRASLPASTTCGSPLRDLGTCSETGVWSASTTEPTCGNGFVATADAGQSCSDVCGRHKAPTTGCAAVPVPVSVNPLAKPTAEKIGTNPGTRCSRLVTGCYCCAPDGLALPEE